jgi:hypothetical protein
MTFSKNATVMIYWKNNDLEDDHRINLILERTPIIKDDKLKWRKVFPPEEEQ